MNYSVIIRKIINVIIITATKIIITITVYQFTVKVTCCTLDITFNSQLICSIFDRYFGPTATFGGNSGKLNVEQWRCVYTLRGHTGGEPVSTSAGLYSIHNSRIIIILECMEMMLLI